MKWGQASRRQKKPWHSDVAGEGGASPSKPWQQDAVPKPSVAHILGALSFEGVRDDIKNIDNNNLTNNKVNSDDSNEWECLEQHNGTIHTNNHKNVDSKSQQDCSVTEDCTESETGALESPLVKEDQDKSATMDTTGQALSPSGSVYYNAKETEEEAGELATKETEVPILDIQESFSSSSSSSPEAENRKYKNPSVVLPSSPVQSRVQYFSEEWPSIQQQLSQSSSKSSTRLESLVQDGTVQRQVQTVELTAAQQACKRLAHAAAAAAQKRMAQRDERLASLFVKTTNSQDYQNDTTTTPALDLSQLPEEPFNPDESPTNSSPTNRADQIQSELEMGRQRALAALAQARQQQSQQQQQQAESAEDPTKQVEAQPQIHVKSTVLMAGAIGEPDKQEEEDDDTDDDENQRNGSGPVDDDDNKVEDNNENNSSSIGHRIAEILDHELSQSDDAVVQTALQFLVDHTAISKNASSQASWIIQNGNHCIPVIVRAMERHVDSATVQITACQLLERLALDTHQEIAIGEAGGVQSILKAMRLHNHSAAVHAAAWGALWNCTCGNACDYLSCIDDNEDCDDDDNMLTTLVSWMREHSEDAAVQAHACGTFANLCVAHTQRLQQFIKAGGFQVMAAALQRHWQDESVRREVTQSMTLLLAGATSGDDQEDEDISIVDQVVLVDENYCDGDEEVVEEEVVDDDNMEDYEYEEEVIDDEEETLVEYFEDEEDHCRQHES